MEQSVTLGYCHKQRAYEDEGWPWSWVLWSGDLLNSSAESRGIFLSARLSESQHTYFSERGNMTLILHEILMEQAVWATYKRLLNTRKIPGMIGAAPRGDQMLFVINLCQGNVRERFPPYFIPVTDKYHSTKDHIEHHKQCRLSQVVHGVQHKIAAYHHTNQSPKYANSRCRDCNRPADSAQAMSAAVLHLLTGCCDRPSSEVILQITNDCQFTHHCNYHGDDVDDQAD